ncbi:hypothetical protein AMR72_08770 [Flavobacterium psychrophilum]|nr:hypothetical protein AMR72_08770 [Flavobacterium psychrophilum]AOE52587.1 hypothetical protein ALW18_08760 [Flavobacterium psychrophilum]
MKIDRKFNTFTFKEYFDCIENHKKYTDFNTLGLYRSLTENEKLDTEQKIEVREYAHSFFKKQFDFLQIKDPETYIGVSTIGQELTEGDTHQMWVDLWSYQEKTLKDKRIKHRNFGVYSKHNCPYEDCRFNGMMVRQGSGLAERSLRGANYYGKWKAGELKSERKNSGKIIQKEINLEDTENL